MKIIASALLFVTAAIPAVAQKKEIYKFGKIDAAMLQTRSYAVDTGASAVILADIGTTEIEGNAKGWFSFVFRRHKRVHILSKAGYDEATVEIPLSHNGSQYEERLDNLKATAFNLENGAVVETKISKDGIFTEKRNKNLDIKKFTVPAVREGTIIDIEYKITSDYLFTLQPWDFQGTTPRLWSEYRLLVPQFFEYMFIYKGYVPFHINDKTDQNTQFTVVRPNDFGPSERMQFMAGLTEYRWVTKDVPGFRNIPYLSTYKNFLSHMDFQLAGYRYPIANKNLVPSWQEQTKQLLDDESFGLKLDRNNGYLSDVMAPLMRGSKLDQARNIYAFVRDNVRCDGEEGIYLHNPVKDVFRERKGTVAEVNLLLVTMLGYAGIKSDPGVVSTRSNGTVFTAYPMLSRFNYIIASAEVDNETWYLDASKSRLGFGRLTPDCYNGMARTINAAATPVILLADSLQETKMTNLFLGNPTAKGWTGSMQQVAGYFESYRMRRAAIGKGKEAIAEDLRKTMGGSIRIEKLTVDSLDRLEAPLAYQADIRMELNDEDLLYINPMFGHGMKENPFKSPERDFPVEMPYGIDEVYNFTFYIPDGYELDELPKPMRMKLNEQGDGSFEYLVSQSEGVISLRSRIRLKRATYTADEYETLREFFNRVVTKHNEQIVIKKKKK